LAFTNQPDKWPVGLLERQQPGISRVAPRQEDHGAGVMAETIEQKAARLELKDRTLEWQMAQLQQVIDDRNYELRCFVESVYIHWWAPYRLHPMVVTRFDGLPMGDYFRGMRL
jgi:hypothetical protein